MCDAIEKEKIVVKKPYLAFSDWNHGILLEVYHVSRHNHINWQHLRCAEIVAMDVQFKFLGFLFARMWSAPLKVYIFNVAKLIHGDLGSSKRKS